jgi:hypothetical protein
VLNILPINITVVILFFVCVFDSSEILLKYSEEEFEGILKSTKGKNCDHELLLTILSNFKKADYKIVLPKEWFKTPSVHCICILFYFLSK